MKSWILVAAVALIPLAAASVGAFVDEEVPDTETIMKGIFKKGSGKFSSVLKKQVDASPTDWDAVQKTTKEIATLGGALEKNDPEKGSKESWKKMAGKFGTDTKALNEAAEAKDLAKVKAAQKSIGGSCKSCHDAHRGQ